MKDVQGALEQEEAWGPGPAESALGGIVPPGVILNKSRAESPEQLCLLQLNISVSGEPSVKEDIQFIKQHLKIK